ncbi:MAG: sortase [Lachnospiraceae bacterium]|nr:sortase [Lachnospiraceae bacterium]
MKRKTGIFCMIFGAVLVSLALSLFFYNQWDAARAERDSAEVLEQLEDQLIGRSEDPSDSRLEGPLDSDKTAGDVFSGTDKEMREVTIDGYDYIGCISIPSVGLSLPVMSEWSYDGLRIAPGRFSGSVFTDDLVIAGHNYRRHFGPIRWLEAGMEVDFTDMDNRIWRYEVMEMETLSPIQVEDMISEKENEEWDLTLFTCTTGGQTRCAVRCRRMGVD